MIQKHACLLCSSMSCCIKEGGCWKSQWQEHRCCVYNIHSSMERSCHSLPLGQWDSKTLPFCCSDKTFIFEYFPTWVQSKPQWFLFSGSFLFFAWDLSCFWQLLKPSDLCKNYSPYSQSSQPFMPSLNVCFGWIWLSYVQIICSTIIQCQRWNGLRTILIHERRPIFRDWIKH